MAPIFRFLSLYCGGWYRENPCAVKQVLAPVFCFDFALGSY
jgi:hypothetical protein